MYTYYVLLRRTCPCRQDKYLLCIFPSTYRSDRSNMLAIISSSSNCEILFLHRPCLADKLPLFTLKFFSCWLSQTSKPSASSERLCLTTSLRSISVLRFKRHRSINVKLCNLRPDIRISERSYPIYACLYP